MLRQAPIACVLGTLLVAACSKPPTSPSTAGGTAVTAGADAEPGGGTPAPSLHSLSFGPSIGEYDGYPSPGYVSANGEVMGWITGTFPSFKASASASGFMLTISDVDELPDDAAGGDPCTEAEQQYLRDIDLVAAPVTGNLTLTIDQDTQGSVQGPTMAWELGGIVLTAEGQSGYTWRIVGGSGSTNPLFWPKFATDSTNTQLTATVENGRARFYRYPNGGRKPSADQYIACRVDLTMVMTKLPQ